MRKKLFKYYMKNSPREGEFDGLAKVCCVYNVPLYIHKLEREACGHIECEKPLSMEEIIKHELMQDAWNTLSYAQRWQR